jgi:hypothetical protein
MSDAIDCGLRTDYRRPEGETLSVSSYAHDIIEGHGGMNNYELHEMVIWHVHERVAAVTWAIRCLANPKCSDAGEVLDAILAARGEKRVSS